MSSVKRQKDMTWEGETLRSAGVQYAAGEERGGAAPHSSREKEAEAAGPKQK